MKSARSSGRSDEAEEKAVSGGNPDSALQKAQIIALQAILQLYPVNWKGGILGLASTIGIERKSHFPDL
jgi:hypothetical protein